MWTETENDVLIAVLDELIPANQKTGVPAAGALGVASFLPTATSYAPDPVRSITAVLKRIGDKSGDFIVLKGVEKIAVLRDVETDIPVDFGTLVQLTYMGYYSRPEVRSMFGVGAHAVHPKGYDVPRESDEFMESLTAPVLARGKFFRDV